MKNDWPLRPLGKKVCHKDKSPRLFQQGIAGAVPELHPWHVKSCQTYCYTEFVVTYSEDILILFSFLILCKIYSVTLAIIHLNLSQKVNHIFVRTPQQCFISFCVTVLSKRKECKVCVVSLALRNSFLVKTAKFLRNQEMWHLQRKKCGACFLKSRQSHQLQWSSVSMSGVN